MTAFHGKLAAFACGLVMMGLAAMPAIAQEAAAAAKPATEDARLAAFFEEVFQRNLKDSPIFQAQLGMKGPGLRQVGRLLRQGGQSPERTEQERPRQAPLRVQVRRALEPA